MHRACRIVLPPAGIARLNHEVPPVTVEARAVQNVVFRVEVDVAALHHDPVLVVAEEQVRAPLVEEPALDTLATLDAIAERVQQLLLSILLDDHVLVGPRLSVGDCLAPRCVVDQFHDVRPLPRCVVHVPSSSSRLSVDSLDSPQP